MSNTAITVSGLNMYVKSVLTTDINLMSILVKGEISNLSVYKSGHMYLTLKDEKSAVKAVMFAGNVKNLKFMPENGMSVVVKGKLSVYERDGVYQINIDDMTPDGLGALYLRYEQLKQKLQGEGLFDDEIKKPISAFPKKIAVITSKTGAVINDIKNVLSRRYPIAELVLYPVSVQGANAPGEIISAFNLISLSEDIDTVILARGGGSLEDLWCFNDEGVARAIAACNIPVISGVGHETDFTIADFVADLRAPTPSAAAELVAVDLNDILQDLVYFSGKLDIHIKNIISNNEYYLDDIKSSSVLKNHNIVFEEYSAKLDLLKEKLYERFRTVLDKSESRLSSSMSVLSALNPLDVLKRGYAILYKDEKIVRSVNEVSSGDSLKVKLSDGILDVKAENP